LRILLTQPVPAYPRGMEDREAEEQTANKYRRLPARARPEEWRTSQDVVQHAEPVGEADRERDWLLRTTGIFI
jgi:hypothetical protein